MVNYMTIEILNWIGLFAVIGLVGSVLHLHWYPDSNEAHLTYLQTRLDAINTKLADYNIKLEICDNQIRFEVIGWLATYAVEFRQLQCVTEWMTPSEAFALTHSSDGIDAVSIFELLKPIPALS
ncbi:hypothetical protein AHP1_391 [Aeromonas phage Ahp1_CNU-2021]|nr:hypothetical protein AHP1_391 [Aeromonas phage Ahp1_CNU-2021]